MIAVKDMERFDYFFKRFAMLYRAKSQSLRSVLDGDDVVCAVGFVMTRSESGAMGTSMYTEGNIGMMSKASVKHWTEHMRSELALHGLVYIINETTLDHASPTFLADVEQLAYEHRYPAQPSGHWHEGRCIAESLGAFLDTVRGG